MFGVAETVRTRFGCASQEGGSPPERNLYRWATRSQILSLSEKTGEFENT